MQKSVIFSEERPSLAIRSFEQLPAICKQAMALFKLNGLDPKILKAIFLENTQAFQAWQKSMVAFDGFLENSSWLKWSLPGSSKDLKRDLLQAFEASQRLWQRLYVALNLSDAKHLDEDLIEDLLVRRQQAQYLDLPLLWLLDPYRTEISQYQRLQCAAMYYGELIAAELNLFQATWNDLPTSGLLEKQADLLLRIDTHRLAMMHWHASFVYTLCWMTDNHCQWQAIHPSFPKYIERSWRLQQFLRDLYQLGEIFYQESILPEKQRSLGSHEAFTIWQRYSSGLHGQCLHIDFSYFTAEEKKKLLQLMQPITEQERSSFNIPEKVFELSQEHHKLQLFLAEMLSRYQKNWGLLHDLRVFIEIRAQLKALQEEKHANSDASWRCQLDRVLQSLSQVTCMSKDLQEAYGQWQNRYTSVLPFQKNFPAIHDLIDQWQELLRQAERQHFYLMA